MRAGAAAIPSVNAILSHFSQQAHGTGFVAFLLGAGRSKRLLCRCNAAQQRQAL